MARPRKYDREALLDKAMLVFWARGYDGTTTDDLEAATNLKRGSLYNAFGDKHGLYLAVIDHYGQFEMGAAAKIFAPDISFEIAALKLLELAVAELDVDGVRRGCLICDAAIERAPRDVEVAKRVRNSIDLLRSAIAKQVKSQNPDISVERAEQLSDHLTSAYMGLKVFVKAGYARAALQSALEGAYRGILSAGRGGP